MIYKVDDIVKDRGYEKSNEVMGVSDSNTTVPNFTLNNGVEMPLLGLVYSGHKP